jgi:predicted esterase
MPFALQDAEKTMSENAFSKDYVRYSLERTAQLLADSFPHAHVFVIRPVEMRHDGVYSCFENFVDSADSYGSPKHEENTAAMAHLGALAKNLESRAKAADLVEGGKIVVGFSKGAIVLNQLLYTMRQLVEGSEEHRFAQSIRRMIWLDGAHDGKQESIVGTAG